MSQSQENKRYLESPQFDWPGNNTATNPDSLGLVAPLFAAQLAAVVASAFLGGGAIFLMAVAGANFGHAEMSAGASDFGTCVEHLNTAFAALQGAMTLIVAALVLGTLGVLGAVGGVGLLAGGFTTAAKGWLGVLLTGGAATISASAAYQLVQVFWNVAKTAHERACRLHRATGASLTDMSTWLTAISMHGKAPSLTFATPDEIVASCTGGARD